MTELKLDFDSERLPEDFVDRLGMLVRLFNLRIVATSYCRTRHGWHVVVLVNRSCSFLRVVAFQVLLGSDWKREAFNLRRATKWRDVPPFWRERANVLYRRHYRSVEL